MIPYHLYHKIGKTSIYKPKKYFAMVSICIIHLLKYEVIIFFHEIVNFVISIGQNADSMTKIHLWYIIGIGQNIS